MELIPTGAFAEESVQREKQAADCRLYGAANSATPNFHPKLTDSFRILATRRSFVLEFAVSTLDPEREPVVAQVRFQVRDRAHATVQFGR
jgi:hypothetical protein